MSLEFSVPLALVPIVAESGGSLITWTPLTFYVVAGLVQSAIIWVGYRLLGADPEHNTIPAALAAAGIGNIVAFVGRSYGVAGFAATALGFYVLLLLTSGIDIFRSLLVFVLVLGSYGMLGNYVSSRTSLDAYSLGGVPKVIMTGGFKPDPIDEKDGDAVPYLDSDKDPN